jgi:hypothetical protein
VHDVDDEVRPRQEQEATNAQVADRIHHAV